MTLSLTAVTATTSGGSPPVTGSVPAGVVNGSGILCIVVTAIGSSSITGLGSTGLLHAPGSPYNDGGVLNNVTINVLYKISNGTEPGSYALTASAGVGFWAAGSCRIDGGIDPVFWDTNSGTGTALNGNSSATSLTSSMTTHAANELVLNVGAQFDGGTWTQPAGFTKDFTDSAAPGVLYFAHLLQAAAGGTGTLTTSVAASANQMAVWLGAIVPAGGGGGGAATPQPIVIPLWTPKLLVPRPPQLLRSPQLGVPTPQPIIVRPQLLVPRPAAPTLLRNPAVPASSFSVAAVDGWATADAVTRNVALNTTAADTWTTADAVTRNESLNTAATDGFTTADTPGRTVALNTAAADGWTTADVVTRVLALNIAATDGWTTSDVGAAVKTQSVAATDAFTTADSVTRTLAIQAAGADAFTTADAVTVRKALNTLAADGWISADVVSRLLILGRQVTDGWQTADVATTQEPLGFLAVFIAGPVTVPWLTPRALLTPWKTGPVTSDWITGRVSVTAISALSRQLVQVPLTELVSGLPVDPTALPVWVAFKLGRQPPAAPDWLTGSWSTSSVNGQYLAQVLVGPGGGLVTLTPGIWTVWLKVEADPEQPIIQVDSLTVY
jgi:hypothetical protein